MLYLQFKNQLDIGNYSVVIIEGDDAFLRDDALQCLKKSLDIKLEDLNTTVKEGDETNVTEILSLANSFPIMSEKRLIVVRDFLLEKKVGAKTDKNLKKLIEYCEEPNPSTCLVFFYSTGKCPLSIAGLKVDCNRLRLQSVSAWIMEEVEKYNKKISRLLADKIAEYCNCDMSRVFTSVNKLLLFCEKDIEENAVELLVPKDIEVVIIDLSKAISARQSQTAVEVCQKILTVEPPIKILQTLYTIFRRMFFVFVNGNLSNDILAERFATSSYAVSIAKEHAKKFGVKKLREAIRLCAESNCAITNFYGNDKMILNDLVLSLCNL